MLNPSIGKLLKTYDSRYQLVVDVAKRARRVAEDAESQHVVITEKPVNIAINDLAEKLNK